MKINFIKSTLKEKYNISEDDFDLYIKKFEKTIKHEIKKYSNKDGIDDYKMNKHDFIIFYNLYINTNDCDNKINILLYFMYSYYKLDGLDYNKKKFPLKQFFDFINNNNNIHNLIHQNVIGID